MPANENEVLFKEKYGSNGCESLYLTPKCQTRVVILNKRRTYSIIRWLTSVFLPQGYPDSVSRDYINYQIWDTAQAFCSTITGTLATQEVLRGVGVGDTNASPLSATITWVLKDGCGHIGRIYFASSHGLYLDAYSKRWRLYADCLNDAAMCIEMALPFFQQHTTLVLCLTTVMKAVVGVAGGATRAALTQHHAVRFNMADVAAKDSAQETAVNLIASIVALAIITLFGNSLIIFSAMVVLHIAFNYLAVRSVCLRTLNEPRFLQTIHKFLKYKIVSTPCEINRDEPIIFYQLGKSLLDLRLCGFQIKLGNSLRTAIRDYDVVKIRNLKKLYSEQKYMLHPDLYRRQMYVMLKEEACTQDILQSYFHAVVLCIFLCAINDYPLSVYEGSDKESPFTSACLVIKSNYTKFREDCTYEDNIKRVSLGSRFNHEASDSLLEYTKDVVESLWSKFMGGLKQTGWNLDKHLIVTDEWRIHDGTEEDLEDPKTK